MPKLVNMYRPRCANIGCDTEVSLRQRHPITGVPSWHTLCSSCRTAERTGKPLPPGKTKRKKDYCESPDCKWDGEYPSEILDLDHIDGNRLNDSDDNFQTLCRNCHSIKTKKNGDSKNNNLYDTPYYNPEEQWNKFN